ncbi:MAG: myxococcus cysteine-rich repeat containing protein [Myxococcota bacterium]
MKTRFLTLLIAGLVPFALATTASAHKLTGAVYCDANQNQIEDLEDLPLGGVEVVAENVDDGASSSDFTTVDGFFFIEFLYPGTWEATLNPDTLPADAVVLGTHPYPFVLSEADPFDKHNFLVDSSICHAPVCGDGILDEGEICDDGNNEDGDGCSAICTDEVAEGCTPGYWKQDHHFDSWTAPYTPDTLFSAVFEDAFPGKTLVEVASLGGGGLNALGRHTVAALLNAASADVGYNESVQTVIDAFNAVYPGTKSEYNALKDDFQFLNELGCPLN